MEKGTGRRVMKWEVLGSGVGLEHFTWVALNNAHFFN